MFDTPDYLRATARRYRSVAHRIADQDVIKFFNTVADQYDLEAATLEASLQNRIASAVSGSMAGAETVRPLISHSARGALTL